MITASNADAREVVDCDITRQQGGQHRHRIAADVGALADDDFVTGQTERENVAADVELAIGHRLLRRQMRR